VPARLTPSMRAEQDHPRARRGRRQQPPPSLLNHRIIKHTPIVPAQMHEHELGLCHPPPVNSPLQPLDRRLLRNRRGALTLAAALAAFVPLCWIVIQLHGSFPGDSHFISRIRHPHPGEPLAFLAHLFALLGNPIVAALSVAIVWAPIDDDLGPHYGALARGHHATFAAMLLLILAMGPLRILDGAHWPSDVLAGYALALAWTIGVLVIGLPWAAGQKQTEDHLSQPDTEATI
jgi:hypothetical protein